MSGDDHAAPGAEPPHGGGVQQSPSGLRRWMKAVFDRTPWGRRLNRYGEDLRNVRQRIDEVNDRLEIRLDEMVDRTDARLDAVEEAVRAIHASLDDRLAPAERRQDATERALAEVSAEAARLRDEVVPAMVGRSDVLLERLAGEIDEVGSLVERVLRREPLPVPDGAAVDEPGLASALAEVQPALLEAFRGPEAEIRGRLERYLGPLTASEPVLDLGCGRGELLMMLRDAGVSASGIEDDPSLAAAARRRGLDVVEGDVLAVLRDLPAQSRGAATAIHLFEHLEQNRLLGVLAEIRRVLRPGGLVIAEFPNPHTLRVGGSLFWVDPTHNRPLMPETMELYLTTSGFVVDRREPLHPFPVEEHFAADAGGPSDSADAELRAVASRLDELCRRLDELVNGPRDVVLWARRPEDDSS